MAAKWPDVLGLLPKLSRDLRGQPLLLVIGLEGNAGGFSAVRFVHFAFGAGVSRASAYASRPVSTLLRTYPVIGTRLPWLLLVQQ